MRHTFFSTITIQNWISVFEDFPITAQIILESFEHLAEKFDVKIYAFVIMPDHIHFVWDIPHAEEKAIINSFKKFTAKKIVQILETLDKEYLTNNFTSNRKDRKFKIWKLNSNTFKLTHPNFVFQRINYIHNNPTTGRYAVCQNTSDYEFSSAQFYLVGNSKFKFLNRWSRIKKPKLAKR